MIRRSARKARCTPWHRISGSRRRARPLLWNAVAAAISEPGAKWWTGGPARVSRPAGRGQSADAHRAYAKSTRACEPPMGSVPGSTARRGTAPAEGPSAGSGDGTHRPALDARPARLLRDMLAGRIYRGYGRRIRREKRHPSLLSRSGACVLRRNPIIVRPVANITSRLTSVKRRRGCGTATGRRNAI